MSSNPEILKITDVPNPSQEKFYSENQIEKIGCDLSLNQSTIPDRNDDTYNHLSEKTDENYFTKNFDECMKRLQIIEKEHEIIEKDEKSLDLYLTQQKDRDDKEISTPLENRSSFMLNSTTNVHQTDEKSETPIENSSLSDRDLIREEESNRFGVKNGKLGENTDSPKSTTEKDDETPSENKEESISWYSSLKQNFEKSEERKSQDISCQIIGATLKNSNELPAKSESKSTDTRHYFSRLVKSNKSLIDEELPDPDKIKSIRAMFQENLNSTLKKNSNKNLGGSLQNLSLKTSEQMARSLSAQCSRNDIIENSKEEEKFGKEVEVNDGEREFNIENTKRKLLEKFEKELKVGKDVKNRKLLQSKWTDTGSVSSGVSSDLSNYDTDVESFSREGTEQEQDDMTVSDDDLLDEGKDKHYVQNEVLEKIRYFGTSVTYYGGEMLTCSIGPLLSPTTQAIIEEIEEKYEKDASSTRSFDEFYRKYVETNETNRRKKLGRTRSFGQNDLFQKPNVLSNNDIEKYKNDLEIEIGIKKPSGIPQNAFKMKLTKSFSEGCSPKTSEVSEKNFPETPIIKIDTVPEDDVSSETNENVNCANDTEDEGNSIPNGIDLQETEESDPNSGKCILIEEKEIKVESQISSDDSNKENANIEDEKIRETERTKEDLLEKSNAIPEGDENGNLLSEDPVNSVQFELPSKEILFGYEKSLLNGKNKNDMTFENFEVCETVYEKLEKVEEKKKSENSKLGENERSESLEKTTENNEIVEKENSESFPVVEINEKPPVRKWNIDLNKETSVVAVPQTKNNSALEKDQSEVEKPKENDFVFFQSKKENINQSNKKFNNSRWPIETTVMVDIQKSNEQTPKVITNGKTTAKSKIRLF